MKNKYDFNLVKCGICKSPSPWTPPLSSFADEADDERHKLATMISECFEECGEDCAGIDANLDEYDDFADDNFDKDPIYELPMIDTEEKRNGAMALAVNLSKRYSNATPNEIMELVKKIYSLPGITPETEKMACCYL